MVNNELITSNYYLAYLDILGTKDIVAKDENDKYLNELNQIYKRAINTKEFFNDNHNYTIKARIFSDNILLYVKAGGKDNDDKLKSIITLSSMIQIGALLKGYLLRGGITYGKFFENKLFIHGEALIKAVNLEEKNAIYPRIVIDENCLDCYKFITTKDANCEHCNISERSEENCIKYCGRKHIKFDSDGTYYINSYISLLGGGFDDFKMQLLNMLSKYKNNLKIKQKIMWSINYHNDFCISGHHMYSGNPYITDKEILDATK